MSALRAVILDFDGVIVESNGLKTEAFERVFARFPEHADAMMSYHRAHVSESRFAKFRYLATVWLGRAEDDPIVAELGEAFSVEMLRRIDRCPLVPGAIEFLTRVRGALPVFLVSVTPQAELDTILDRRGLTAYFTRVYGCPPWSKVRAVADIVAECGDPHDVLFIGDSAGDRRASRETGVEFVARDSGLPFDAPPPRTFPDMDAVLAAIAHRLPA